MEGYEKMLLLSLFVGTGWCLYIRSKVQVEKSLGELDKSEARGGAHAPGVCFG
jgi:hypothetical protein